MLPELIPMQEHLLLQEHCPDDRDSALRLFNSSLKKGSAPPASKFHLLVVTSSRSCSLGEPGQH